MEIVLVPWGRCMGLLLDLRIRVITFYFLGGRLLDEDLLYIDSDDVCHHLPLVFMFLGPYAEMIMRSSEYRKYNVILPSKELIYCLSSLAS